MFQLRYAASELRRRAGRTILTALGLAAGVGLVLGIIGVSQGLDDAQQKVLSPLSKVGTDVLVTRVAGATPTDTTGSTTTTAPADQNGQFGGAGGGFGGRNGGAGGPGAGGPGGFFGGNNPQANALNQQDTSALLTDNDTVETDLSKLGPAGTKFTHDFFLSATLLTFPDSAIGQVAKLPDVTSAVGGMTLLVQHETGTVPNQVVNVQTGGETINLQPLTDAERQAMRQCLIDNGAFQRQPDNNNQTQNTQPTQPAQPGQTTPPTTGGARRGGGGGAGGGGLGFLLGPGGDNSAFQKCLPARYQQVVTAVRNIQQVVNPPQTDTSNTSYTAAGVDPNSPKAGLVTTEQVTSGRFINPGAANEVLINVAYANKKNLKAGDTLPINDQTYTVVGLVAPTLQGNTADIYFPLPTLQTISSKQGRINAVLVKAKDAASVDKVAKEVQDALPGAQVVTTKQLSDQVTGSLKDAKNLANRLGGALGVIVLIAAFAIAVLLTLSSVAKRVREIGTLRAIGWPKTMVVRQVLIETLGIGLLGGLLGVLVGYAASAAVGAFSPTLQATTVGVPSFGNSSLSRLFGGAVPAAGAASHTIKLHAPIHPSTLLLGVAFALIGGLIAGAIGGWRAARMSPAEALRTVG